MCKAARHRRGTGARHGARWSRAGCKGPRLAQAAHRSSRGSRGRRALGAEGTHKRPMRAHWWREHHLVATQMRWATARGTSALSLSELGGALKLPKKGNGSRTTKSSQVRAPTAPSPKPVRPSRQTARAAAPVPSVITLMSALTPTGTMQRKRKRTVTIGGGQPLPQALVDRWKRAEHDLPGSFCDTSLHVDGKQFYAHKVILASCSDHRARPPRFEHRRLALPNTAVVHPPHCRGSRASRKQWPRCSRRAPAAPLTCPA
jgi:hypothetical protein